MVTCLLTTLIPWGHSKSHLETWSSAFYAQFGTKHSPSHLTTFAFIELAGMSGSVTQTKIFGFAISPSPSTSVISAFLVVNTIRLEAEESVLILWFPITVHQHVLQIHFFPQAFKDLFIFTSCVCGFLCVHLHYLCVWCRGRSEEGGGSSGTGVTDVFRF